MKLVGLNLLKDFQDSHVEIRSQLDAWVSEVEDAQWQSPQEVKDRYATASILDNNRVVFNIKGNKFRLLVQISYKLQIVRIQRIGTHAEYSKWKL